MTAISSFCNIYNVLCRKVRLVVENIQIAVILISVESDYIVTVTSPGKILIFKENNHLYYRLQLKAIVGFYSMSINAVCAGLVDFTS